MRFVVSSNRPAVRPGPHRAVVTNIEERQNERGTFLIWEFEVQVQGGRATLRGTTSTKFGTGAKARAWVEALLRRRLAPGEEIESDDLLGLPCFVVVNERARGDGSTIPYIEQVLPVAE